MPSTKVLLSDYELALVQNSEWILTKQSIIEKVVSLFGECVAIVEREISNCPDAVFKTDPPKISRGENYKGLPYVMLDYPRNFDKDETLSLRTMFWWGRFFSITWHVSGSEIERFHMRLTDNHELLKEHFYICINEDPWQHDFASENYIHASAFTTDDVNLLKDKPFIKVAIKFSLEQFNTILPLLIGGYRTAFSLFR